MNEQILVLNKRRNELLILRKEAEKRLGKLKYKGDPQYHIKIHLLSPPF